MINRRRFSDEEKKRIYDMYGGRCAICGEPVSKKKMTVSHRVPLSKDGTNGIDNLVLACWGCNQMQHNLELDEFMRAVTKIYNFNKKSS